MEIAFLLQPWETARRPGEGGSIAIWTHEVARRLARDRPVTVYARRGDYPAFERADGVAYRRISLDFEERRVVPVLQALIRRHLVRGPDFASPWYHPGYGLQVGLDLRRRHVGAIHLTNFSQFPPILRALVPRARIVLHMQCEWLTQQDPRTIARRLRSVDAIVGCSDHVIGKVARAFPHLRDRCHVVPNGTELPGTGTRPDRPGRTILFVGRVSPEKGVHVLLEAFEKVARTRPDARLVIVGSQSVVPREWLADLDDDPRVRALARFYPGSYLERLEDQIPPDLRGRVEFAGAIPHPRIAEWYERADVAVNPSLSEAFGMSVVEAMAAGLPVVATRVGGMVDSVLEGETGLFVPPDDAAGLARAIDRLLADGPTRRAFGEAGRRRVEERFSWDVVARQVLDLHETLAHRSRARAGEGHLALDAGRA